MKENVKGDLLNSLDNLDYSKTAMLSEKGSRCGYVHSVEIGGFVDGPGMRIIIFTAGCPLRCLYCHNPDSRSICNGMLMDIRCLILSSGMLMLVRTIFL